MRGAVIAPLVFLAFVLASAGSAVASPVLWTGTLAALACGMVLTHSAPRLGATPIALALWSFAGWTVCNDLVNGAYTAAAVYHPALMVGGFFLVRGLDADARQKSLHAVLAGAALLALWALAQAVSGEGRGHACFETPNTLAAVINLLLAPMLFHVSRGEKRRSLLVLAVLMSAGLAATLSRGGMIALAGGLVATLLMFRAGPRGEDARRLLGVLVFGAAIGLAALEAPAWVGKPASSAGQAPQEVTATLNPSVGSRLELYRLALSAAGEHPWLGAGYLSFHALLGTRRAEVPSYPPGDDTYFVHEDYLQTLLELGLPGLGALMAMIAVPFWRAKRAAQSVPAVAAPLAGIATMAVHGLGDFPFYVPICLLLFGALLGEIDTRLAGAGQLSARPRTRLARLAGLAGAMPALVLVLAPPSAELAAKHGDRAWRAGDLQAAGYGFELARRLQPADWRYHWYAGQFWYSQAQSGNAAAAPLADKAFAAAVRANPAQPRPLLARVATQMRFGRALDEAVGAATLRAWADRALALAPLDPAVRRQHEAALARLTRKP